MTVSILKYAELKPADGYIINGVRLDNFRFIGRMKGSQLLKIVSDPRNTEDTRQRTGNTALENLYLLRQEVQRLFDGAKRANVGKYAEYIVQVHGGHNGMTPPIILYSEEPLLQAEDDNGNGIVQIPWDGQIVAIDGETQLAARHQAASMSQETSADFVPIMICHGRPISWARQVFHDLNLLAVRPNAAVGIGMDQRDPLTHVARVVEEKIPFFKGRVNKSRRQLRRTDKELVTITALRGACITLAEGIGGVKYGAKSVFISPDRVPTVEAVALQWFTQLSQVLGPAIENRDNTVASSPAVLAALGAMGHELVAIDDDHKRAARSQQLLDLLTPINWSKGKHWEGIAGKFTPKGEFSIGGPKETAYAIYNALKDSQSTGFLQIRPAKTGGI